MVVACEAEGGDDDVGDAVGGVEDVNCVGETGEIVDGSIAQCSCAVSMPERL